MVNEIFLDDYVIKVFNYEEVDMNNLLKVTVDFKVTSEEYHDITTLLYKGIFDVKVPKKDLTFRAKIQQYSTSFTNLYVKGQVGDFRLSLLQVRPSC